MENVIKSKRFVVRQSLVGQNKTIDVTFKNGKTATYNHDAVYNKHSQRFNEMKCFNKYKSYTNTNCMPAFCRDMKISQ